MDFWRTLEILNRRKWLILLSGIIAASLTWGATRIVGSKWMAVVEFVSPEQSAATQSGADASGGQMAQEDNAKADAAIYATILKSQAVTQPVLQKLAFTQLPPDFLKSVDLVANGPRLFALQVTDTTPTRAAAMANGLADQFVKVNRALHTQQAESAVRLLQAQMDTSDRHLNAARARYDAYRSHHQIIGNLNTQVDAAVSTLQKARQARDEALVKVMDARARLQQKEGQLASLPAPNPDEVMAASPTLTAKREEISKAEADLATLRMRYTDEMPVVQEAVAHRDSLAAQLQVLWKGNSATLTASHNTAQLALKQEIRSLKQEIAGAQAGVATLDKEVQTAQQDINRYKGLDGPFGQLAGAIAEKSEGRTALATRLAEARLALDVAERQNPLVIMNRVSDFNPPINTTKGRTLKLIVLAMLGGMVCTCAVIIALNSVDRRLRTVQEAAIALPKGILAAIPQPLTSTSYSNMARITEMQPQSLHSEAYRFLGLHLLSRPLPQLRSIMVLAAKAEQGSTTTLTNLGITLAQAGKRVLIVDANIRTSEIHMVFDAPNDFGFTDVLREPTAEALEQAIQHSSVPGLAFITSGPAPENPWGLFRSQNLAEMSRLFHQHADYVLYDTPSSLMFTDALNIASIVDGAILCVRAQQPLTGTEERLVEMLEEANVTVLGSVLNDVPASVLEGYTNYQDHYEPQIAASSAAGKSGSHLLTGAGAPLISLPKRGPGEHRN